MQNIFITKIHIDQVRHLKNVDIVLSDAERKHLIFTGKNGSGKTSLLEAMRDSVLYMQQHNSSPKMNQGERNELANILYKSGQIDKTEVGISYSDKIVNFINFMFVYIPAERSEFVFPKSIEPVNIEGKTVITRNASRDFLRYILNLDYRLYGAKTENNKALVSSLEKWFDNFQSALREIYDCAELKLQRDTKNLAFKISIPGRKAFGLHEMADGYAAFLDIYMELLMRFECADAVVNYEQYAIVMIDEIETHLHVELQKRALPFFAKLFPNVQFIVATHSPFVMTSLENAIVYDLEKNERLEKPSFYSYDTIVESFLDTSLYSNELKRYFERYKELCFKKRTVEENEEFLRAKAELEIKSIPSTELFIAFQALEKRRKEAKNGSSI